MITIDTTNMCSHLQRKLCARNGAVHPGIRLLAGSKWRMKEFTDEKGIPFWEITKEGETIEL